MVVLVGYGSKRNRQGVVTDFWIAQNSFGEQVNSVKFFSCESFDSVSSGEIEDTLKLYAEEASVKYHPTFGHPL